VGSNPTLGTTTNFSVFTTSINLALGTPQPPRLPDGLRWRIVSNRLSFELDQRNRIRTKVEAVRALSLSIIRGRYHFSNTRRWGEPEELFSGVEGRRELILRNKETKRNLSRIRYLEHKAYPKSNSSVTSIRGPLV
jgi:hypothetical protein